MVNAYKTMSDYDPGEMAMRSRGRGRMLISTIVVFIVLVMVGVGMVVGARSITNSFDQSVVMHIGTGIFTAGLSFFLLQMFAWAREFGEFRD